MLPKIHPDIWVVTILDQKERKDIDFLSLILSWDSDQINNNNNKQVYKGMSEYIRNCNGEIWQSEPGTTLD